MSARSEIAEEKKVFYTSVIHVSHLQTFHKERSLNSVENSPSKSSDFILKTRSYGGQRAVRLFLTSPYYSFEDATSFLSSLLPF